MDLLAEVATAAAAVADAKYALDEATSRRDAAVRAAWAAGHPRAHIADRAGLTPMWVNRLTQP